MRIFAILISFFLCATLSTQAQDKVNELKKDLDAVDARDRLIFEFGHTNWINKPDDSQVKWYSRAFNVYFMYDIPFNKGKNIAFAPGIGIGTNVVAHNSFIGLDTADLTIFTAIPEEGEDAINYTRNNLSTNYFDVPLELRFRSNPDKFGRRWKAALGFKAGYLFNAHTKYVGNDFRDGSDREIKFKEFTPVNINFFRYGYTLRVGYSNFNLIGYYSASTLFELDRGPGINPFFIGFSFNSL